MTISRMKVLGLLGLPLLAIAVAVMVFAFGSSTSTTQAATDGTTLSLAVAPGDTVACPQGKTPKGADPMFCVANGTTFTVQVVADAIPLTNGYVAVQSWVNYGNVLGDQSANGAVKANQTVWPDCAAADLTGNTDQDSDTVLDSFNMGCLTGLLPPLPVSFYKGVVFEFDLTCDTDANHILDQIEAGTAPALTNGAQYTEAPSTNISATALDAEVNCVPPPPDTPTPTTPPTATPPPVPRMQKCAADTAERDPETGIKTVCDNLVNVFLTRQSSKIPPADCLSGTNPASFVEQLSQEIVSPDPKGDYEFQQLAGYEFEVHYDSKKVCVDLTPGDSFAGSICVVEDSASKPTLEGVARIGCVTPGKSVNGDHDPIDELAPLATVDIYPQPEIYSPMKPNQDNGNTVQINNVNCDITDEQGHAIPLFSCDDADVTFRYLEGDVEPDCVIDAVDAQAIAFRWGVQKGSLIYKDFMNLEPSSQQADNDIDINDLQFVFGRFGSTCDNPWPAQAPVNPKA